MKPAQVFLLSVVFGAVLFFVLPQALRVSSQTEGVKREDTVQTTQATSTRVREEEGVPHVSLPTAVRALYMSQCVVGTPSFREKLVALVEETELNAVVIDVKDYTGKISFPTENPLLKKYVSEACGAPDMHAFVKRLHEKGIYVIARITVFQDPFYTHEHPELAVHTKNPEGGVWKDRKGLSFIDVGATPFWEYIVALSQEAFEVGFDEINYDYVRYPSDGNMDNTVFSWTKEEKDKTLESFFHYLSRKMKDPKAYPEGSVLPVLSADLFGMTTTAQDDMGIGQVWERALPYFDVLAPMVYPSHYPKGFNGWENPNAVPYDLLYFVLKSALERAEATSSVFQVGGARPITQKERVASTSNEVREVPTGWYEKQAFSVENIRPWIQDFDYGGEYGPKEVRAQIQAAEDLGLKSWMLWAPSNIYTREALMTKGKGL